MPKKILLVLLSAGSVLALAASAYAQSTVSPAPMTQPAGAFQPMPPPSGQPTTQQPMTVPMMPSSSLQPEISAKATDIIKNILFAPIQPNPLKDPSITSPPEQRGTQPFFQNKENSGEGKFRQNPNGENRFRQNQRGEEGDKQDIQPFFQNKENSGEGEFRQNRNREDQFRQNQHSEEGDNKQREEMDKRREEEQKRMEERGLADMKRGIKNMERNLSSMEKRMKMFEAKGVVIPQDMKDALEKAKSLIEQAKNAKSMEEIDALDLNDFGDYMQIINEGWQKLEMAAQFPKILKQADKELARMRSAYAKAETKSRTLKIDVSSLLVSWKAEIDKLSEVRDKAKQLTDNGQAEEGMELMRDEFFGEMENVNANQRILEMLAGTQKMIKNADLQIVSYGKKIARLKKSGEDTAKLESLLSQAKIKVAEIKQVLAQTPVDSDALTAALHELENLKADFDEELNSITGEEGIGGPRYEIPGLQNFKPIGIPKDFENFIKKDHEQEKQHTGEQQNQLPPINQKPAENKVSKKPSPRLEDSGSSLAAQFQAQIGNLFNFLKAER